MGAPSGVDPQSGALVAFLALLTACGGSSGVPADPVSARGTLPVTSPAFADGAMMPVRSTCDGEDTSPSLAWSVPVSVAEWAITMEDLDAGFVHWVAYGIPGQTSGLLEGRLPPGSRQGRNDFGDIGYGGPCPPREDGPHRYRFTVYALAKARVASMPAEATLDTLLAAIGCCVQVFGTLTGRYDRT